LTDGSNQSYNENMALLIPYKGKFPQIEEDAFVAPNATLIGDVVVKKGASIWYNAVLRGDLERIEIGEYSNIQDNVVVHVEPGVPVIVGNYVTVGHAAILHGCIIEDYALIGMGATILDHARIGKGAVVAAGAVVLVRKEIPPLKLVAGIPAEIKKDLPESILEEAKKAALRYYEYARGNKEGLESIVL